MILSRLRNLRTYWFPKLCCAPGLRPFITNCFWIPVPSPQSYLFPFPVIYCLFLNLTSHFESFSGAMFGHGCRGFPLFTGTYLCPVFSCSVSISSLPDSRTTRTFLIMSVCKRAVSMTCANIHMGIPFSNTSSKPSR